MLPHKRTERLRNLPDLPYDLCEYIARFLPDDDVRKLYFINRNWYEISMSMRYKEAALSVHWARPKDRIQPKLPSPVEPPAIVPKSAILSPLRGKGQLDEYTPEMARRVRSFKLVFKDGTDEAHKPGIMKVEGWEKEGPIGEKVTLALMARVKRAVLRATKRLRPNYKPSAPPIFARHLEPAVHLGQLTSFTESLVRVDDLTIAIGGLRGKVMVPSQLDSLRIELNLLIEPFIISIWSKAIGPNLKSLTISVPMEFWVLFFQSSFRIDQLENLGILFSSASSTDRLLRTKFERLVETHIAPFVRRHAKSLTSLDIISPYFDCSTFFQRIGHLPSLDTIKVEECGGLATTRSEGNLYSFLERHGAGITHVAWKFSNTRDLDYDVLGRDIWLDLRYHELLSLPKLEVLELKNLTGFSDLPTPFLSNLDRLLRSHNSTLTKLCLEGYNPYLDTFYDLLDSISSTVLEHFEISTRALPRDLLSTMATKLPSLRFLRLSYHDVGRQTVVRVIQLGSATIISYPILDFLMSNEERRILGSECPLHALYKYHFLEDMKDFTLPNWPIEELYLETTNKSRSDWEADSVEINKAVLRSIPSVVTLNGLHRNKVL